MNIPSLRLRYTQIFLVCFLTISISTMLISLSDGILRFQENFWNHTYLIASFTELRLTIGDRIFSQAIVGKQNWMEYTRVNNIDMYQNASVISPKMLKTSQINLQKLYNELQKRNITLLLMIAPNKITMYPDKFSENIPKLNKNSSFDLFTNYLAKNGPPILIDVRQALQNGRKKQDTYYRTDTHWNDYGAFIAYTEMMKELSKTYPALTPKSIDDYTIKEAKAQLQDIANVIGATNLLESNIIFTPKKDKNNLHWTIVNNVGIERIEISTTNQKTAPTLLMYMDSFGIYTKQFIAPHFQKATFIYINSKFEDTVSLPMIDIINPNIVIIEIAERKLNSNELGLLNRFTEEK